MSGFLSIILLVGVTGILGQIVLLREFLITFYGNELSFGVILANWLILEGTGALWAGRKHSFRRPVRSYGIFLLVFAVSFPVALILSRGWAPRWFGLVPGESGGLVPMVITSLVLLAPVSLSHGALFTLACRILPSLFHRDFPIGRIYLYETLGTLAGGVLFTSWLATRVLSLEIALVTGILHVLAGFWLYTHLTRRPFWLVAVPLGFVAFLALYPAGLLIHQMSLNHRFAGQEVLASHNTPYGNIVVTQRTGEYTIYYDGRTHLTLPYPDAAQLADFVQLTLTAHPQPDRVLLAGGGLGGLAAEVLTQPVQDVVVIELDPLLPAVLESLAMEPVQSELADPRTTVRLEDGYRYLSRTQQRYDVILLGFFTADTLQTNRFFTREFFQSCRDRLREGGILGFSFPGTPSRPVPELAELNRSVFRTMQEVFPEVQVIPGESYLYLASSRPFDLDPGRFDQRWEERAMPRRFFSRSYLEYRLDPLMRDTLRSVLQTGTGPVNTLFHPVTFARALIYQGQIFTPELSRVLDRFYQLPLPFLLIIPALLVLLFACRAWRSGRKPGFSLVWAIGTSGAGGMAFDLLCLLILQSLYGYVFQMAGLIVASFMTGVFLGGRLGLQWARTRLSFRLFWSIDLAIAGLLGGLYGVARLLHHVPQQPDLLLIGTLSGFIFLAGSATGSQFPLASSLLQKDSPEVGTVAGRLYAADLIGGWAGGILISLLLYPRLGLGPTLLGLILLKGCGWAAWRPAGQSRKGE